MYIGVDIGGSKTLVAVFTDDGTVTEKVKFPTPSEYATFLTELGNAAKQLRTNDFRAGCIAVPGKVDRDTGVVLRLANLPWQQEPLQADSEKLFGCPIRLEHDGVLAGLSEAQFLPENERVLYVTISTGIGTGFISHRQVVADLADSEGGHMVLPFHGKRMQWEEFASGRAIVERFGKQATDITDPAIWKRIAHDLAAGFIELIAVGQPDTIIIGGSVGASFDKFGSYLIAELRQMESPMVHIPAIRQAQRPDEAVIYGCYYLAHSLWK